MLNIFELGRQMDRLKTLMQDERGRQLLSHPKLQKLLSDNEFAAAVKEKNFLKILSHPEFVSLTQDAEFQTLMMEFQKKMDSGTKDPA